jgi:hypothetical protein
VWFFISIGFIIPRNLERKKKKKNLKTSVDIGDNEGGLGETHKCWLVLITAGNLMPLVVSDQYSVDKPFRDLILMALMPSLPVVVFKPSLNTCSHTSSYFFIHNESGPPEATHFRGVKKC